MSADPAVEAAQRAWGAGGQGHGFPHATEADLMIDSAREALARIRELHKPETEIEYDGSVPDPWCPTCVREVYGDLMYQPWPCDTARLCYPEEEL